jgi:hypothetical protein
MTESTFALGRIFETLLLLLIVGYIARPCKDLVLTLSLLVASPAYLLIPPAYSLQSSQLAILENYPKAER